jgi:hypothetical protein
MRRLFLSFLFTGIVALATDDVYRFGPYTPSKDACATLQIPFESNDDVDMSLAEAANTTGHTRLVPVRGPAASDVQSDPFQPG